LCIVAVNQHGDLGSSKGFNLFISHSVIIQDIAPCIQLTRLSSEAFTA
jgi:hypothetical protein